MVTTDPGLMSGILVVALILSFTHYYSHKISLFMERYHFKILSFSAGTLIATLFVVLLPEVIELSDKADIYLLILLGFVMFHVAEKFLYQHIKNKKELIKDLRELHLAGFFADHFILGFALATTLALTGSLKVLIIIPFFLHTISSSISLEHLHEGAKTHWNKVLLSCSTTIGALTALTMNFSKEIHAGVLAVTIGMLLYIVSRDILPDETEGSPLMFVLGIVLILMLAGVLSRLINGI